MSVTYGWTWADFRSSVSHNFENEADYIRWENFFSQQINDYIFDDLDDAPVTDTEDVKSLKHIVHRLMVELSIFQKGNSTGGGFVTKRSKFPRLRGDPLKEMGAGKVGSGDYAILNRIKSNLGEGDDLIWSIRAHYDGNKFNSRQRLIF